LTTHTHTRLAPTNHTHNGIATIGHAHSEYAPISHTHEQPAWFGKLSYDDIGQYMDPAQPSSFHIVVSDSLTPSANTTYNLGNYLMRFLFGFFQRVRVSGNAPHYDDKAATYEFLRSYVAENAPGSTATWLDLPGQPYGQTTSS
jgi:hypothetical protein